MILTELKNRLMEAMESFEIIDCHEHLPPERVRVEAPVDVFTLFSHYTHGDLRAAGMAETDYQTLSNQDIPLERRWILFKPYWRLIRWTSYARAVLLAAERFYGFSDIDDDTYAPLSAAIRQANRPGIYERVLRDACSIRTALTQCRVPYQESPLFTPVLEMPMGMGDIPGVTTWQTMSHPALARDVAVESLDGYLDAISSSILQAKGAGVVGLKMISNAYGPPDRSQALETFDDLRSGRVETLPELNPLRDYVVDRIIRLATGLDLVIAVHTGYWGDFRKLSPLHMIPLLERHPEARFDIFHLGYPWVRETLMLGKGFPNVWLNLCWTHIISQRFAVSALDEAIDLLPTNKLLAFGGDYELPVEKIYGHLVMARENIAEVLAQRIVTGQMTEAQALDLARMWFWDNPIALYRLEL